MSATVTSLEFKPPEVPEDNARAGYYALLARLFYSSPDAALLETIAGADEIASGAEQSALADAWNKLAAAARAMDAEAARLEYDEIFVGTGKAEVTLYATYYLAEAGREKILVRLRDELAELGLARSEAAREPEDHFAGLLDVMRHLILLGSDDAALQNQAAFFGRYLAPACPRFCRAISENAKANFYKHVAHFASAFFTVETEAMKVF
ncbi:MAG TPA: molecular chaperone TorD family protein [Burkholderiales bacterium]